MTEKNYPHNVDKIKDFVTRPIEPIKDLTGAGDFSLSPLGFPNVNVSETENPTRISPSFKVTYKDAKFYVGYDYFEDSEIGIIRKNLSNGSSSNTINLDDGASSVDDFYNGYTIKIVDGTGKGQNRNILDYVGLTREVTVDVPWATIPDSTSIFLILIRQNIAQGGSTNTIILDTDASSNNGFYDSLIQISGDQTQIVRKYIRIIEGTGKGQTRFTVTNPPGPTYNGTTKEVTVTEDWTTIPDNTSVFVILQTHPYKWDGTENDNKEGTYVDEFSDPIIDPITGEPVNHFRKDYSSEEVTAFLRQRLEPTLTMGKDRGILLNWLLSNESVNVGGGGGKTVFIDPFGINSNTSIPRTSGPVNLNNPSDVIQKRQQLARHRRSANWLISNDVRDNLVSENKSPFLKNYPDVYNSEYLNELIGTAQAGASSSITLDASAKTSEDFYNDSTIEITSGTGSGQIKTITDYVALTKVATVDTPWSTIPDNTSVYKITNMIREGGHLPSGVVADDYRIKINTSITPDLRPFTPDMLFYMKENSYHNNITLDLSKDTMFGRHHISILHKLYHTDTDLNDTIINELDNLYNTVVTPGTDPHIIRRIPNSGFQAIDDNNDSSPDRNVVKYLYKRRKKNTVTALVPSPTFPSSTELQYTDSGANEVTIHLIPGSNNLNYVISHATKTSAQIRSDIMENNELVPGVILSSDLDDDLEAIFVRSDTIDISDPFYAQEKVRSKKTFIHIPTKGIKDGYCLELDISLPKELDTPVFVENTLGVLSGYKNYITQPRAYVFSGYQIKAGDNCNLDVGLTEKENPYLMSPIPELEFSTNGNSDYSANIFHQRTMDVNDIYGNKLIRKVTFNPTGYVDAIESDIGKLVQGASSLDMGRLINFDNTAFTWIIRVFTAGPTFNDSEVISVLSGTGTGTGVVQTPSGLDKRNLLAVLYPTTTNTFAWRLDKNPRFKLMYWSIMANTQYENSASFMAYKRNRSIVTDYNFYDDFDMGLTIFPLSYKNDLCSCDSYVQYISGHTRFFFPSNLIPQYDGQSLSQDELNYGSMVYQGNKTYNNLIADFYKGRIRLDLRSDMTSLDSELQYIGFNNSSIIGVPSGYFDGYFVYINTELPSIDGPNAQRWMTKPNDLPKYIPDAVLDTGELWKDPFQFADDYRIYLQNYFGTKPERESDATVAFIPGTLYPVDPVTYEYGAGLNNILVTYLIDKGVLNFRINDLRRNLWQSSFDIPFYSENHPGFRRKYDFYSYDGDLPNLTEYNEAFYGMAWSPFTNLFSLNGINITENSMDTISDISTIQSIGYESAQDTLLETIKGNPISERYYKLSNSGNTQEENMSKMAGIHDDFSSLNPHTNEFIKNFITTYSNEFTKRFYNSYRTILTGKDTATEHDSNGLVENYDTQRTYQSNVFSYFTNIVDAAIDRPKSTDDDYILLDQDLSGFVKAEDFDYSWTYFDKGHGYRGLSSTTTAQSGTFNTITLDAGASSENYFYEGNLITIVSGTGAGQTRSIVSYDGTGKVATVDSNWTTIPDNTSVFQIKTHIKNLLTANGQQYKFSKSFYDSKGEDSYIRTKMKFIFSEKMGRWITLDYRQMPMTYLTPSFGNTALSYKEKSIVYPGKNGSKVADFVPIPDPNYSVTERSAGVFNSDRSMVTFVDTAGLGGAYAKGTPVVLYDKKDGFLDSSRYTTAVISSMVINHLTVTQEWNPTTIFAASNYVKSEDIVYFVTLGPVSGYLKPKYNTNNYFQENPNLFYAPIWNSSQSYKTGDYVTYGNSIYQVIQDITGGLSPNLNGFNYIIIKDFGVSAPPWSVSNSYVFEDLVTFNGIIYEVVSATVASGGGNPSVTPANYRQYISINPYAIDWNSTDSFAAGTYVFYNKIFYRTVSQSVVGIPPNASGSFVEVVNTYTGDSLGGIYDTYTVILDRSVLSEQGNETFIATYTNTISSETYPNNPYIGSFVKDYLWKHPEGNCFPSPMNIPYYKLKPMELNKFCIPFLSKKLPYDKNGILFNFIERWKTHDDNFATLIDDNSTFEDYTIGSTPESINVPISTLDIASGAAEGTWFSTFNTGIVRRNHTTGLYTQITNFDTLAGAGVANRANGMDSDSLGNAYFASDILVKFDGSNYTRFTGSNSPASAKQIYIDKGGDIAYVVGNDGFFVSASGFSTQNPASMSWTRYYYGNTPALPNSSFIDVHKGPDSTVWFIALDATNRVFKFDGFTITTELISFMGINQYQKSSIRVAPNGDVFTAGYQESNSIAKIARRDFATSQWIVFDYPSPGVTSLPGSVRIDSNGTVFIATTKGLYKYLYDGQVDVIDAADGMIFPNDTTYEKSFIYSMSIDETNNIWLGGYGGILYYRRFSMVDYEDYIPYKLKKPHNDPYDSELPGIDFVVPNNVYGGQFYANRDLYLFHPHMFRVYWHIRPVVSAYSSTDIPSPTDRIGGTISDPCLGNMFNFPKLKGDQEFVIPWHNDMNKNWSLNGEDPEFIITENEDPQDIIEEVDDTETEIDENV